MNKTLIAWAAGFFDGEGHIETRKATGHISLHVTQKDKYVLEVFKCAVGGVGHVYTYNRKTPDGKPTHCSTYQVGKVADVLSVLTLMFPHLVAKGRQSQITIGVLKSKLKIKKTSKIVSQAPYVTNNSEPF